MTKRDTLNLNVDQYQRIEQIIGMFNFQKLNNLSIVTLMTLKQKK